MVQPHHAPREPRPGRLGATESGRFLFPLGHVVSTPGALRVMEEHSINAGEMLRRHASGDWGDLCEEDRAENERALRVGSRLFSVYGQPGTESRLWVITETDRSVTTILRPDDY